MTEMIFASDNGRIIPKEDKIFGISNRAKAMSSKEGKENVINATIGALLDDEGKLVVLSSIDEVFKTLEVTDYAEYAPIGGTAGFKEAVKKDLFRNFKPERFVEAVATPGGTGAIKNTISNYSNYGDKILVGDWFWAPYSTIAQEQGRTLATFNFLNEEGAFDCQAFNTKIDELLAVQDTLVIILNTPSHNPTGYAISGEDWDNIIETLNNLPLNKRITLLVDAAYVDFADDDEEDSRMFLPFLQKLKPHILPIVAHSLSKAYTLYGLRCGAMICMASSEEVAREFKTVCEFSSRGSWSNCPKAPQVILEKIYKDEELLRKVKEERKAHRAMLLRRGEVFTKAAREMGLEMVPFHAGFFATVPCHNPEEISAELEKEGIFTVPLAKGVRISLASLPEGKCEKVVKAIKKTMDRI